MVENECMGGTVIDENFCLCDTSVEETPAYNSTPPSRADVLALKVGAHDITMFSNGDEYSVVEESSDPTAVSVYTNTLSAGNYSINTVFRVRKDEDSSEYVYFKNIESVVKVCGDTFSFRNSPTFYDIVNPELVSAYQETEG